MSLVYTSVLILLLSIFISLPKICWFFSSIKSKNWTLKSEEIAKKSKLFIEQIPKIEELTKIRPFGSKLISEILVIIHLYRVVPFALRMALIFRFGVKIAWRTPFSFYEVWDIFILFLTFQYAKSGQFFLSVLFALMVLTSLQF